MNVLRQYEEAEVPGIWRQLCSRLDAQGRLVEGTCSETGRVGSWVTLGPDGPLTLTLSLKVDALGTPEIPSPLTVAERLPKALIHRNVPGEPTHGVLQALEDAWQRSAAYSSFGTRHRWLASVDALQASGVPVMHSARRWRLGELTLPWQAVAPLGFDER